MLRRLMMLGPPGAGKGTQAQLLCKDLQIPQISTGDMLRAARAAQTELGKQAGDFMDRGALVPDEVVVGIVRERLEDDDVKAGFILDGFPRTQAQAQALVDAGVSLDAVIYVTVPDTELVERITGRLSCKDCGAVYHRTYNPPSKAGVCDSCSGTNLYQRPDDNEATVRARLKSYYAKTAPLVDFYTQQNILHTVEGIGAVEEIQKKIRDLVG